MANVAFTHAGLTTR